MSRLVGEASVIAAILPNINYRQMDIKIYPAVTCHVKTNKSVTFLSRDNKTVFAGM